MLRLTAAVALALACAASTAFAAHNHHRIYRHHYVHRHYVRRYHVARRASKPITFSLFGSADALVREAQSTLGKTAMELGVRRTLWCMAAVNHWLRDIGKRGSGSDLAFSALRLGPHIGAPQPGALAVMRRRGGGHVGVVAGVTAHGDPVLISGNYAGRVREAVYPRGRIMAYVIPR